jgi:hypothetical protein
MYQAGTNLGVSTLGTITASIRHYRQRNIQLRTFTVLAVTGAVGAFIGSFLTGYIPIHLLLTVIGVIVMYESFVMLRGSRVINKKPFDIHKHIGSGNELSSDAVSDNLHE